MSGEKSKNGSTQLAVKLAKTLEATCGIRTKQDFLFWAERDLRLLIPHQLLICGQIEFDRAGVSMRMRPLVRHEYECASGLPDQSADEARLLLSLVRGWTRSVKPQLLPQPAISVPSPMGEECPRCLPTPLIFHGMPDTNGRGASYVVLCGVGPGTNSRHAKLLELVVPHMHMALTKLLQHQRSKPVSADTTAPAHTQAMSRVSLREREVMQWLQEGKTNWEIAQILGKSEHTVKNQVRSLLLKLRVNNRAQAVAKMSSIEAL